VFHSATMGASTHNKKKKTKKIIHKPKPHFFMSHEGQHQGKEKDVKQVDNSVGGEAKEKRLNRSFSPSQELLKRKNGWKPSQKEDCKKAGQQKATRKGRRMDPNQKKEV